QAPILPAITGLKSPPQPPATPADGTLDTGGTKGTACLPCSTDHLSTSSASLAEAMRFARKEGVGHPEVMRRVDLAQDELNVMERIDMHPATVANLPPDQKEFLNQMIPKIREVRQDLGRLTAASPVSDLENVAARMDEVKTAFRNKTRDILAAKIRSMTPQEKSKLVDSLSSRLAERVKAEKKGESDG
ncbi:MAG: hypothetical protein M0R06_17585, partial [Sphaerochaeta sp.]|nr:hypothetical protein [Sphaerochaeta sp.]